MSKGERTRQMIIEQSASLFNQKGYAGTALDDIMTATGSKKGGIYNHFSSKDDIALSAFDYAMERLNDFMSEAVAGIDSPLERLIVFIKSFAIYHDDEWIDGGCPILNTAIEQTDNKTNPALREKALSALKLWQHIIQRRLEKAISAGEARPDTDIQAFATLAISSLEGAVMLSRIYDDYSHLERVINHLLDVIERDIRLT